jgi:hypothetical protein
MNAIVSTPEIFLATSRARAKAHLLEKLDGKHPAQPQPIFVLDQDIASQTYLQQIPADIGSYITSVLDGSNPVQIAGRVCLAKAAHAAQLVTAGSASYSTSAEIAAELERQNARLIAVQAEDARLKKGAVPFTVSLPGQGSK